MKILIISGSPRNNSHSRILADVALKHLEKSKDKKISKRTLIDLHENHPDNFRGFGEDYSEETKNIIEAMKEHDAFIISTPVYNTSYSSAVKNIFEHSNYKGLKGKTAGFIINSGGTKSFENAHSDLNSLMNYFGIFSNPKAVYVAPDNFDYSGTEGKPKLKEDSIKDRIQELVDSTMEIADKLKPSE